MDILHINTFDNTGGAARAAYRLHMGLQRLNQDSRLLVRWNKTNDPTIIRYAPPRDLLSRIRRKLRRKRIDRDFSRYQSTRPEGYEPFSDDRTQYGNRLLEQIPTCDIVNLHWIARFVDYSSFFGELPEHTPVVWTLHDMNAFTGGCHVNHGCSRFYRGCGACPQLGSKDTVDLSYKIWARKRQIFAQVPSDHLHIVTPSHWLAEEAQRSPLLKKFSVSTIPNGLDMNVFKPRGREIARAALEIPLDADVILFVAQSLTNKYKGFRLLAQALRDLDASLNPFFLSVGSGKPETDAQVSRRHLGHINRDWLLALVYSAADVFVIPSLQENLPNTIMESLACGTPVVGFDVGGIPDMVRPGITGQLAPVGDVEALREAIVEVLRDPAKRAEMSANCRRIAIEEYALEVQARRYVELYKSMLG